MRGAAVRQWNERYECVMEPTQAWLVWDRDRDEVAELPGTVLVGLSGEEAVAMCRLLNRRQAA